LKKCGLHNKPISGNLISDIRRLIETARHNVAVTVNAGLPIFHWQSCYRNRRNILKEKQAGYGKKVVATLSQESGNSTDIMAFFWFGNSYSVLTIAMRYIQNGWNP